MVKSFNILITFKIFAIKNFIKINFTKIIKIKVIILESGMNSQFLNIIVETIINNFIQFTFS